MLNLRKAKQLFEKGFSLCDTIGDYDIMLIEKKSHTINEILNNYGAILIKHSYEFRMTLAGDKEEKDIFDKEYFYTNIGAANIYMDGENVFRTELFLYGNSRDQVPAFFAGKNEEIEKIIKI